MSRAARAVPVAILFVLVFLAGSESSQRSDWPSSRIERIARWLQAVRGHQPGKDDAAVRTLSTWNNADIGALWFEVQTLIHMSRCGDCKVPLVKELDGRVRAIAYNRAELLALRSLGAIIRERKETNEILERGAILHADVVMIAQPVADLRLAAPEPFSPPGTRGFQRQPQPAPDRLTVKSSDGRQDSVTVDPVHLDIGYVLLDLVGADLTQAQLDAGTTFKPTPHTSETVRNWYRATSAYLLANGMHDLHHFGRGLKLFPLDEELIFLMGCLHESQSGPRVQTVMRSVTLPPGVTLSIKSEREELELAAQSFRAALAVKPDYAEARLRLGRVLGRLGRHENALTELRQVNDQVDQGDQEALRYFTELFIGHEEEAMGRRDEARSAYGRASDLFPLAQSPQIALSHLAREAGDRDAALASIQRVLTLPVNDIDRRDPLWLYFYFGGRFVDVWLDQLYRPFRHKAAA